VNVHLGNLTNTSPHSTSMGYNLDKTLQQQINLLPSLLKNPPTTSLPPKEPTNYTPPSWRTHQLHPSLLKNPPTTRQVETFCLRWGICSPLLGRPSHIFSPVLGAVTLVLLSSLPTGASRFLSARGTTYGVRTLQWVTFTYNPPGVFILTYSPCTVCILGCSRMRYFNVFQIIIPPLL